MSGAYERELIKKAYPRSITWPGKVDAMSDAQVFAILLSLRRKGIIK